MKKTNFIEELKRRPTRCQVTMTEKCQKELRRDLEAKLIKAQDMDVIKMWVIEMEKGGPERIKDSVDWGDHPLNRNWAGYRSSMFSQTGRIIYRIINGVIEIAEIAKITPDHNYQGGPYE